MGKYIKVFDEHTDYQTYINGQNKILPNVSVCIDQNDVHYNPLHDYTNDYLTIISLEDNNEIGWMHNNSEYFVGVTYSLDNGRTWTVYEYDPNRENPFYYSFGTFDTGDKILLKGTADRYGDFWFTNEGGPAGCPYSEKTVNVVGNIMSMLYGDNFVGETSFPESQYGEGGYEFACFFTKLKIISAENLILPATTLHADCYAQMFFGGFANEDPDETHTLQIPPTLPATTLAYNCYEQMFRNCKNLIVAPELPATTMAGSCYQYMFRDCTSLTEAPELPATTLANYCYNYMFSGCTSLTTAPVLRATTLQSNCYGYMFYNCTALTTAPDLPATTLVSGCYKSMFQNCSSLNYIKAMFTTEPSNTYTQNWVNGVASSGTFVKNSSASWTTTGTNAVPTNWTVQTASE